MKSVRERFEEIWPVPEGVIWDGGEYMPEDDLHMADQKYFELAAEHDARLDTFTRCQETTPMVGVIVDDLIRELDNAKSFITDGYTRARITCTIENAKQIMEQKK